MRYSDMPLENLIEYVLTQPREADFWDVKEEWHQNVEELVKDIICFANTVHDEDCYLIIGVTNDLKVRGIGADDMRRKQSDILDILSQLPFAGDNIPKIEIKTIFMPSDFEEEKIVEIDVLIIYNSYSTPYYLKTIKDKYHNVMMQGCIYSRVGDKNTPNKGNAEIWQIEMLWKKRFGLTKPPLKYIIDSLSHKLDWQEYNNCWYNIYKPEYVLHLNDEFLDSNKDEFYSYTQTDETTYFCILDIIANNTILKQYQMVYLDGGRLLVPVPKWSVLNIYNPLLEHDDYKYYIKDSARYKVLEFIFNSENPEERSAFRQLLNVVLIFESDEERKNFERYVEFRKSDYSYQVEQCEEYGHIKKDAKGMTAVYKRRLHTGVVLKKMLTEYRKEFPNDNY